MEIRVYDFTGRALEQNKKEIENAQEFLIEKFSNAFNFGTDNLIHSGIYKLMGWAYDCRPFLKKYLYKQYGDWREVYSPNKTMLRKVIHGKIDKIVEI